MLAKYNDFNAIDKKQNEIDYKILKESIDKQNNKSNTNFLETIILEKVEEFQT
jgi:hypothetical protein